MKFSQLFLLVIIAGLMACNPDRVYESHQKSFPKHRWYKEKALTFEPTISDTTGKYNISVALRHVYGFQHPAMKVRLTVITPSGNENTETYTFPVFGKESQYRSDCSGDICDLESLIIEGVSYKETGTYKYTIAHDMDVDPLQNVMEVGLIIEKQKTQE